MVKLSESSTYNVKCGICGKPLDLMKARSNDGVPVHGDCLIKTIKK